MSKRAGKYLVDVMTPAMFSELMKAGVPQVLKENAVADLLRSFEGDTRSLIAFLLDEAGKHNWPLGINLPDGEGRSKTGFIAPPGWTQERLAGWVAAKRDYLEAEFGPANVLDGAGLDRGTGDAS